MKIIVAAAVPEITTAITHLRDVLGDTVGRLRPDAPPVPEQSGLFLRTDLRCAPQPLS